MILKTTNMRVENYRNKVMACWVGKAIGGTIGMPYEGLDGPFNLDGDLALPAEMVANDDIDMQVVWACVLNALTEPVVDRNILAKAWLKHVNFPWDETGVALRNLKLGIKPPFSGSYDNWFINGMAAAIRSELWACLAPGNPQLAAAYAYEDACVDHAEEGIYSAMFLAALESGAFVSSNVNQIIDVALDQISSNSVISSIVNDTRRWWLEYRNYLTVRKMILYAYGHENFTDVKMNIGFMVLGLLAGEGDFMKTVCTSVNCGKDTDCTAATVGAILGILNPEKMLDRWMSSIDNKLALSPEISGITPPATLEGFTDIVVSLRNRLAGKPLSQPVEDVHSETFPIKVKAGFVNWVDVFNEHVKLEKGITMPANSQDMVLDGTFARLAVDEFKNDCLVLRYQIKLTRKSDIRLCFNTPNNCRVWIDNRYCFGRESGRMAPSPHRTPINQYIDITLDEGLHYVTAAVAKPQEGFAEWVFSVADQRTKQWMPEVIWFEKTVADKAIPKFKIVERKTVKTDNIEIAIK